MNNLSTVGSSVEAKTSMAIRVSAKEAFEAFIDPNITSQFWFTHSDGFVQTDALLKWRWQMYDVDVSVHVVSAVPHRSIHIEWGEGDNQSDVVWAFQEITHNLTYVTIRNYNFRQTGDDLFIKVCDSAKGFSFVLAGMKAWLESGIRLNLIEDAYPIEMR